MALLLLAAALWVLRAFVAIPFTVPSQSMAKTLRVGDRILVDRLTPHLTGIRRSDVVVFEGAAFGAPGRDFVKRVIGVGGDRVTCCDQRGRLLVNGEPLDERAYLHPGDKPSVLRFDVRVPDGRLWVMGDHRAASLDSRAHLGLPGGGTVPEGDLVGRVVGVVWPLDRLGGLASAEDP